MNSLLDKIYFQILKRQNAPCMHHMVGQSYETLTYEAVAEKVQVVCSWIHDHCEEGDHVAIWSTNCWQWVVVDLACQLSGVVSVPIYPTTGMDQLRFIFDDASPTVVFLDDLSEERLLFLESVSSITKVVPFFSLERRPGSGLVEDFEDVVTYSEGMSLNPILWQQDRLNDVFTILYTSGTTGVPKAVPLTHNNVLQNIEAVLNFIIVTPSDSTLSFLPMSHILERTVGIFCILCSGGHIYFARSIDTVAKDLVIASPTLLVSVPRLYEKIYQKVMNAKGLKRLILSLSIAIGKRFSSHHLLWKVAYSVVYKKIHQKTGGNIRFLITGGAPIPQHVEQFFNAIGLTLVQGYGLTETSPIIAVNPVENTVIGSVGQPLSNLDVTVADDGELLVKGPSVFSGYLNVSNEDVFTSDGFFKTGDLAKIDDANNVFITGRKKELIVLSNGKNVSPSRVEAILIQSEYINQIVVVGDNYNYLVALVVPDIERFQSILGSSDGLSDLCNNKEVKDLIQQDIGFLSHTLASFESVKKIQLIPNEFSIDGGELTPTLKLRRKEINKKYQDLIYSLYDIN